VFNKGINIVNCECDCYMLTSSIALLQCHPGVIKTFHCIYFSFYHAGGDTSCLLWVDKYKPTRLNQIVGQSGEKSNVNKLKKWLLNWRENNDSKQGKPKKSKCPVGKSPEKQSVGAYF